MCIVDTPGLGSVFSGNTAATQDFFPHIDAALVVLGADPPLAGEELVAVETGARNVQVLIVVLNKAERTTNEERRAAADFTRKLPEKWSHRLVVSLFVVSGIERLANRGPDRDWPKFIAELQRLVQDSGRQIILAACDRGLARLSEELIANVAEERNPIERPIEESGGRIAAMRATRTQADRSMRELGFQLMAGAATIVRHLCGPA